MRAVRCADPGIGVVDVDTPTGEAGDGLRVRVASASICGSDLHLVDIFPLPVTLGHEFAGWLDDGTPVAVEPVDPCWNCSACTNGEYHLCVRGPASGLGVGRDGGMAEYCLVPERSIVALPAGLDVRDACLVEPVAVAVHGVRRGAIVGGERVVVVGGGSIGLAAVAAARAVTPSVSLVARHDAQREAGARLGATIIDASAPPTFDVAIDAAGTSGSITDAVRFTRPGGRVVMLATYWDGLTLPAFDVTTKELSLITAAQYSVGPGGRDIDVAARLLASNPMIATTLISHRFPLDAAAEAFAVARDRAGGAIKVVLEP